MQLAVHLVVSPQTMFAIRRYQKMIAIRTIGAGAKMNVHPGWKLTQSR
jgi:hypothetical protein